MVKGRVKENSLTRCHKDLKEIINFVKGKYIMDGRNPPTSSQITKRIAKKINKESLLNDVMVSI